MFSMVGSAAVLGWICVLASAAGSAVGGAGGGSGTGGAGGSGGAGGFVGCIYGVMNEPGSSTCGLMAACGGISGGSTIGGVPIGSSSGATPCCLSELVVPPHQELVKGDQRVVSSEKTSGYRILRKCDAPYSFLGLTFGSWTCEIEHILDQGTFWNYQLAPCPPEDENPTDPTPSPAPKA